jgi:hypothetical protein
MLATDYRTMSLPIDILPSYKQIVERVRAFEDEIVALNNEKEAAQLTSISTREKLLFNSFSNVRNRGLLAARQGDFAAANYYFELARSPLDKREFSYQNALAYESYLEQARSYLLCRLKRFDEARDSINKSFENYVLLEELDHDTDFTLNRIQLVHNWVRLEVFDGNIEHAIELAFQILSYLSGKIDCLPISHHWSLHKAAPETATMFMQVTIEIATILIDMPIESRSSIFKSFDILDLAYCQKCNPIATTWLMAQHSLLNNKAQDFLEQTSLLLQRMDVESAILTSIVIVDIINFYKEFDPVQASSLQTTVAKDFDIWRKLPRKIAHYLNVCIGLVTY